MTFGCRRGTALRELHRLGADGLSYHGFCEYDELNDFVVSGRLEWRDGELPLNTCSGNLAEAFIHGFESVGGPAVSSVSSLALRPKGLDIIWLGRKRLAAA